MKSVITLRRKPAFKTTYHALLKEEWGEDVLGRVLQLLDDQLRESGVDLILPWESPGESRGHRLAVSIDASRVEEIAQVLQHLHSRQLPPVPEEAAVLARRARSERERLAVRSWVYLTFQATCELKGEADFFRDVQSLLFLSTVFTLLPALRSPALAKEHDMLVNSLGYHATVVWRDYSAHQQYLLSVLARYVGDEELEENALLASFRLTDPNEHNYLTLAQSYWFFLLEKDRYADAEAFLLGVYRQAPQDALAELREMVSETYDQHKPVGRAR
jgi:hypothetical protein